MKKKIAGIFLAIGITTAALTAGPVITADLGVGGVESAEAYSTSGCHYHYSSFYGNQRYCYIDWSWWEEVTSYTRTDGWHVQAGGSWIRTSSHYHSGWA